MVNYEVKDGKIVSKRDEHGNELCIVCGHSSTWNHKVKEVDSPKTQKKVKVLVGYATSPMRRFKGNGMNALVHECCLAGLAAIKVPEATNGNKTA